MNEDILTSVIVKPENKSLWNRCTRFEYDMFIESGYIAENPAKKIPKYDEYYHSVILMAYPVNKKKDEADINIAGVMRLFYAPHADKMQEGLFPIFDLYDRSKLYGDKLEILMNLEPTDVINIGAMAIGKNFRNTRCFIHLFLVFFKFCCENRYLYGFASLENFFLYDILKRYFTLIDLGPNISFRGAPSILTIIDIFDQLESSSTQR
jgi:hypothetical protein